MENKRLIFIFIFALLLGLFIGYIIGTITIMNIIIDKVLSLTSFSDIVKEKIKERCGSLTNCMGET